jgi:transcription antitermination factor NusG
MAATSEYSEVRWYVAYTAVNQEKKVAAQLCQREISHFLPLYSSMRHWKDRKVLLQLPLFPGYLFVNIPLRDRVGVLAVPGVVRLVGFHRPTAVPDEEVERIRLAVSVHNAEPHSYLKVGQQVRITDGPLRGSEGILLRNKSKCRVVILVTAIAQAFSVEIDERKLEAISLTTLTHSDVSRGATENSGQSQDHQRFGE